MNGACLVDLEPIENKDLKSNPKNNNSGQTYQTELSVDLSAADTPGTPAAIRSRPFEHVAVAIA